MKQSATRELSRLIGDNNVLTGGNVLSAYFASPVPDAELSVVTPEDVNQLSDITAFAFENEIPVFTARRRHADSVRMNGRKGILVDLAKMNQIKKIDKTNLTAHVYGGVTFEQLQGELEKEDLRLLFPVAGTSPSVLRSYLDRDILMGSGGYRHPHLSIFHAMLADGQIWVSGSQQLTDEGHADFREDQGPQFSPFFGASEDIFGIPYYGLVYVYPNREKRRLLAFGFDSLEPAKDLICKASRAEWCFEAFAANDRYLSVILAGGDASRVSAVKKKLSPWTAVVTLEHYSDLVDLWERYTREAAKGVGGKSLKGQIPEMLEGSLGRPWYVYDRDFYRGRCRNIFCYQYFKNLPGTFDLIDEQAKAAGLKPDDLGKIVVPVYFGGSAYCEADLYYDPEDEKTARSAENACSRSFEALLDDKAFVDKPTGPVADLVYERTDPSYVEMIKLFKNIVDPKGILNPDQLLEGV